MERKPRRLFTREFKLEAVRLAAVDGRPRPRLRGSWGFASISCASGDKSSSEKAPGPMPPRHRWRRTI